MASIRVDGKFPFHFLESNVRCPLGKSEVILILFFHEQKNHQIKYRILHTDKIPTELPIQLIQLRTAGWAARVSKSTTVLTVAPTKDNNGSKMGGNKEK